MNRSTFLSSIFAFPAALKKVTKEEREGMRISTDENDPGYRYWAIYAEVYLNGKKVERCVTADEKEGYVIVVDGPYLKKKIHGKVEIKLPNNELEGEGNG